MRVRQPFSIKRNLLFFVPLLALITAYYFFSATPDGLSYNLYTDAVLSGQLNLLEKLNHYDVSEFQGKQFFYFGIAPVLLLLAPFKFFSGEHLPQETLVATFVTLIFFSSLLFVIFWAWVSKLKINKIDLFILILVLGLCGTKGAFLRFSAIYEGAISSAMAFLILGIGFLFFSFPNFRIPSTTRKFFLFLGGLFCGFSVGSRHSYILSSVFLLTWTLEINRRALKQNLKSAFHHHIPMLFSFLGVFLSLLCLNWLRFGNPLDFGISHQKHEIWKQGSIFYGPINLPNSFHHLFENFTLIQPFFPFFDIHNSYYPYPKSFSSPDFQPMLNPFSNAPILIFFLVGFLIFRSSSLRKDLTNLSLFGYIWITSIINLATILFMPALGFRYIMDFEPLFLIGSCISIVLIFNKTMNRPWVKSGFLATIALLTGFSLISSFGHGMTGHSNAFMRRSPEIYHSIARFFDPITKFFFKESDYGPILLKIDFSKLGRVAEPIIFTGRPNWRFNCLFVVETRPGKAKIGLFPGNIFSSEFDVLKNGILQDVKIVMGSLFPMGMIGTFFFPSESKQDFASPFLPSPIYLKNRGFDSDRYTQLIVEVDGKQVISSRTYFYPSTKNEIWIGQNPAPTLPEIKKDFSGSISVLGRENFLPLPAN